MLSLIARNWWLIVLRGVCAILFGLFAWTWPGVTLGVLVLLWAVYAFADGILAFVAAWSGASGRPSWALALEGVVGICAAAAGILYPGVTALVLLYVIAAWALITGVLEIVAAVPLRREIENKTAPMRWNPQTDDVQRSVAQLVLTIVEFLRKLMERQAIRRMEQKTLTPKEVEAVGVALMRLEETIKEIGARFGLSPEDLNLDLGPLGKLM